MKLKISISALCFFVLNFPNAQNLPELIIEGGLKDNKKYIVEVIKRKGSLNNPDKFEYQKFFRQEIGNNTIKISLKDVPVGKPITLHIIDKEKTKEMWAIIIPDTSYLRFQEDNNRIKWEILGTLQKKHQFYAEKVGKWNKTSSYLDFSEKVHFYKRCVDTLLSFYQENKPYEFSYEYLAIWNKFFVESNQKTLLLSLLQEGKKKYANNFAIALTEKELIETEPLFLGSKVLPIILKNEKNKEIEIQKINSKYILIDFWATWCAPCLKEHKMWKENIDRFANRDITIVAISIDKDKRKWEKYLKDSPTTWINVLDAKQISKKFGISDIPRNILLNERREIVGLDVKLEDIERLTP